MNNNTNGGLTSLSNLPPPLAVNKAKSAAVTAWDDDGGWGNDGDDWNFDEFDNKPKSNNSKSTAGGNNYWQNKAKEANKSNNNDENGIDYNTLNLNKLSDWEIQ